MTGTDITLWPSSFEAAVFDFDGTLAETNELWHEVDEIFFAERNLTYTPDVHQTLATLGFSGGALWCIERYGLDETVEGICDEWNRIGAALYAERVSLRPGAGQYLAALRQRGIPVALATTNNRHVLMSMRPHVCVDDLFDAVVCSDDVANAKDEPDIYLEAVRRIGSRPSATIVFEDHLVGILTARNAGFLTCAVRCEDPSQDMARLRDAANLSIMEWTDIPLG